MSGKTAYAILISFMTLFAVAAQAKDSASRERSAVLAAVGNQAQYAEALMKYSAAFDRANTPKAKPKKIAKEETRLPDDSKGLIAGRPAKGRSISTPFAIGQPPSRPIAQPGDAIAAPLTGALKTSYEACLSNGPKECCAPMIDKRAAMPSSCMDRSIASESGANDQTVAPDAETASNAIVSASSSAF